MSEIDSYKFGQKNQWRRWMWNRVVERLKVSPKDATVLYLAGPEDLDREEAMRRGFIASNLIAVDRNKSRVHKVRRNGGLAIAGSLERVISSYPRGVDVVIADLCSGWEPSIYSMLLRLVALSSVTSGGVVVFNLQRGRDMGPEKFFDQCIGRYPMTLHRGQWVLIAYRELLAVWRAHLFGEGAYPLLSPPRGLEMLEYRGSRYPQAECRFFTFEAAEKHMGYVGDMLLKANPAVYSYKSNMVMMDSAVFTHLGIYHADRRLFRNDRTFRQCVANIAQRTMRSN